MWQEQLKQLSHMAEFSPATVTQVCKPKRDVSLKNGPETAPQEAFCLRTCILSKDYYNTCFLEEDYVFYPSVFTELTG